MMRMPKRKMLLRRACSNGRTTVTRVNRLVPHYTGTAVHAPLYVQQMPATYEQLHVSILIRFFYRPKLTSPATSRSADLFVLER